MAMTKEEYVAYFSRPVFARMRALEQQSDRFAEMEMAPEEGVVQCGRCKGRRVFASAKQTRAADEPMTVFCVCSSCGHRWVE